MLKASKSRFEKLDEMLKLKMTLTFSLIFVKEEEEYNVIKNCVP